MGSYIYAPLNEGEIRLITLSPKASGTLKIKIFNVVLNTSTPPAYDALSYVWGDSNHREEILVDGNSGATGITLSVTKNLATALTYLQDEQQPRNMWIDAISINQDDLDERAAQVTRMANIHSLAAQVEIWLGEVDDDGDKVLSLCKEIGSRYLLGDDSLQRELEQLQADGRTSEVLRQIGATFPLGSMAPNAIANFFNREWFERLWIRQEAMHSADVAIVRCGKQTATWSDFCVAVDFYARCAVMGTPFGFSPKEIQEIGGIFVEHGSNSTELIIGFFHRIGFIHGFCFSKRLTAESLHYTMNNSNIKCTDARDRFYGLFAIINPVEKVMVDNIDIDYKKPALQIFQEIALAESRTRRTAEFLKFSGLEYRQVSTQPSWLPHFAQMHGHVVPRIRSAAAGARGSFVEYDGHVLELDARTIGTIVRRENIQFNNVEIETNVLEPAEFFTAGNEEDQRSENVVDRLRREFGTIISLRRGAWQRAWNVLNLEPLSPYPSGGTNFQALCRILGQHGIQAQGVQWEYAKVGISFDEVQQFASFLLSDDTYDKYFAHAIIQDNENEHENNSKDTDMDNEQAQHEAALNHLLRIARFILYNETHVFVLDTGHIGVCACVPLPGDTVAIVLGCSSPLILRQKQAQPLSDSEHDSASTIPTFEVVGMSFTHGLNWGEALSGADLAEFRFSQPINPTSTLKWMDMHTGEEFEHDPRIAWEELRLSEEEEDSVKRNKHLPLELASDEEQAPDDGYSYYRPDKEYILRRGVPLERIKLA